MAKNLKGGAHRDLTQGLCTFISSVYPGTPRSISTVILMQQDLNSTYAVLRGFEDIIAFLVTAVHLYEATHTITFEGQGTNLKDMFFWTHLVAPSKALQDAKAVNTTLHQL